MTKYYPIPFASGGDRAAVPTDSQPDGSISYTDGYGIDYSKPLSTDPAALTIERPEFNQVIFDITSNIQQYQQHGVPEFITSADNGGSPYSYARNAMVRWNDGSTTDNYISIVGSNTALPSDNTKWFKLNENAKNADTATLAATATALATARAIYGNNFDGTAAVTGIIGSQYGGTGNGFTKFTGPTTSEKTFTLPNANASLAPLDSPTFTGTPAAPTASPGTNTTQIATTAFVLANGGTPAPGSITLAMMADLAQDQFIGRVTGSTGVPETATITAAARTVLDDTTVGAMLTTMGGAPLSSPTFTGTPAAPTASPGTNTTQLATTAFVLANSAAAGLTVIASGNLNTGSAALIDIVGIPATYRGLKLTVTGATNTVASKTFTVAYATGSNSIFGTDLATYNQVSNTTPGNGSGGFDMFSGVTQTAAQTASLILEIMAYQSGSLKMYNGIYCGAQTAGSEWGNTAGLVNFTGACYPNTGAITKLRMTWTNVSTGVFDGGTYILEGIN